ncbi:MAG TPA: hypothetical protein DCL35_02220 [Candidatus Omnitrophica bacterium]|nr:hypothetical protein [Candidatus Omnitrophota bacterium]
MKKEISDHLAKAFLETKARQKKKYDTSFVFYIAISAVLLAAFVFSTTILANLSSDKIRAKAESLRLERYDGPYSLKFDFSGSASNIAALDIDIPDAGLNRFTKLAFFARMRKADDSRASTLKVSIVNKRRETSSQYVTGINSSWKKIIVPFSGSDKMRDLSGPIVLSFTLEPWNISAKKGELLIDDIQFLKN